MTSLLNTSSPVFLCRHQSPRFSSAVTENPTLRDALVRIENRDQKLLVAHVSSNNTQREGSRCDQCWLTFRFCSAVPICAADQKNRGLGNGICSHLTRVPRACACLSRETTSQTSWIEQDAQNLPLFFADSSCDGTQ